MKLFNRIFSLLVAVASFAAMALLSSCEDGKSYAELLQEENMSVNRFLVEHRVVPYIPADSVFEVGEDAPYYQLDDEGNIYMQVLNAGSGPKVEDGQQVYFRFTRYNLSYYYLGANLDDIPSEGNNSNMQEAAVSFRYQDYSVPSSAQWGSGIQIPLNFLPLNCDVNLVVKSQYGWTSEVSYVQPYLYRIRYYKSHL